MSLVSYPAYPDPTTDTGWADVPAVMLLVNVSGREDIVYAAMMQEASLLAAGLELRITAPDDAGTCLYLMTITFDGEDPLDIAGLADQEAIAMFGEAELLLIASADQAQDDCAPVLAFAPNDPARWIDRLVAPAK
jgi:hypothetical protein